VRDHVRGVIAAIAPNDSIERFTGLGVRVIQGSARFTGPREIEVNDIRVEARRFVVATGSSAAAPPIPGLGAGHGESQSGGVPYLTNETIFDLDRAPGHLIVIGGGPIGCELAQAHRRLGTPVTVLELLTIMPKDDPELVDFVRRRMRADGVEILEGVKIKRVEGREGELAAIVETEGGERRISGTHLLIAAGRKANVEGLNLEAAGVKFSPKGIQVDARLRTTNKHIYAVGDVTGGYQFTHIAGYHAGIVIRNALFRIPAKVDYRALPWVTFTDPELAHVGLIEAQAKERHRIRVLRWPFHDNDRAQTERETDGHVKVVTSKRGRILGATIVGANAGELIASWSLAISQGLNIRAFTGAILPYPTRAEAGKRAAIDFFAPTLTSPMLRRIIALLRLFG
jgi:pyruvate/2-oxoglutarate dehydrogenase complex dihydrolipoamide dehydrogenase (E3) component